MMKARLIEVIETSDELVGRGTEEDVYRRITRYFTKDGIELACIDPWRPGNNPMTKDSGEAHRGE
jgi:hypothetical protein